MLVTAKILSLAVGGAFVGRITESPVEADVGKKVFVRLAGPAELVEVEVKPTTERFYTGQLVRVIEVSAERIVPPCPVFGTCGGCDLQHLSLSAQRLLKREMVESMLARQGGLAPEQGVVLAPGELPGAGYRQRITVHVSPQGEIGFYRPGTGEVVPIDQCYIARPLVSGVIPTLVSYGQLIAQFFRSIVIEELGLDGVAVVFRAHVDVATDFILRELPQSLLPLTKYFLNLKVEARGEVLFEQIQGTPIKGRTLHRPTGHFAQVNEAGNSVLKMIVADAVVAGAPVTDLFAGAGNFALPLAERGSQVDAVELDPSLVLHGQALARERNLAVHFFHQRCENYIEKYKLHPHVVIDPPRTGAKEVVSKIPVRDVAQLVYVSCDLPTLVRDLKILVQSGFQLVSTNVVDMFPQTYHVETVSVLRGAGRF